MSNRQHHQNVALMILVTLVLYAIYVLVSAGPDTTFFHSTLVAAIKWCFSAADHVQEMGEGVLRSWQEADPEHRLPFPARAPLYVSLALKCTGFAADILRDTGSCLAAPIVSYRHYGSSNPLTASPARIVLAARSLFLPDQVLGVSTWVPKVWT